MRESGRLKRPCGASRRLEAREFIHVSFTKVMTLDEKDAPEKFSVDVSGAESIKIEVGGGWYKGDGSGLIPAICAADLCLR